MLWDYSQIFVVSTSLLITWLDTKENVLARPLSLLVTTVSLFIYYPVGLYARFALGIVYMGMNTYGWYQWLYGGKNKTTLQVSYTSQKDLLVLFFLVLPMGTFMLGYVCRLFPGADLVYWDACNTVLSLIAHWMLIQKKIENWLVWMVVDILSARIFYDKALYPLVLLRILYLFLATHGYISWSRSYQRTR